MIPAGALTGVNLFFPDPWPKKRHHKRRLVQPPFVSLLARKLAAGGRFHVATDWANYAEQIESVIGDNGSFKRLQRPPQFRQKTRFEHRGAALGHAIWEAVYERV